MDITLTELENAINYWRLMRPSTGEERALSPEVNALATIYAEMIFSHAKAVPFDRLERDAQRLWTLWREQQQRA